MVNITEDDVEKRLTAIQTSHGELVSLDEDRPLRKGDFGVIDYKSFMDGEEVPGGSAQNFDLEVGAGYFNTEFEKELEGMKKGEDKEFDIDFPEDYGNPSLAGKKVHYQVKLRGDQDQKPSGTERFLCPKPGERFFFPGRFDEKRSGTTWNRRKLARRI